MTADDSQDYAGLVLDFVGPVPFFVVLLLCGQLKQCKATGDDWGETSPSLPSARAEPLAIHTGGIPL